MAYIEDRFYFPNSIEVEIKWAGNYGAKGEKRAPKEKPTPEQIEKQNQWRKERDVRRLIKANFKRGDYWITFVYPQQTRKEIGTRSSQEPRKGLQNSNRLDPNSQQSIKRL